MDEVGRLVSLLTESGVGEIRVKRGDLEIMVKARDPLPAEQRVPWPEARPVPQPPPEEEPLPEMDGLHEVRSPLVGTFYRSPAPNEAPFVEVGERVRAGQTLCIVEAMKMMNEIPADVGGEVVEVLAGNAEGVEYDQPLFRIRPEDA
ncbi:MAG: acetyl-CoA carboxylase biotin carboxyl carrier protein [Actinomycetota bacterium]